jgi:hypothetical protein
MGGVNYKWEISYNRMSNVAVAMRDFE